MSSGIEEIQYRGNRVKGPYAGLSASLGKTNTQKRSSISDEPEIQQYEFQNFAMLIPEGQTRSLATYQSAAEIK